MNTIEKSEIEEILRDKKWMKEHLRFCASCSACADSCVMFRKTGDPRAVPGYKARMTMGVFFKKKENISSVDSEVMAPLLWDLCVMCGRCYCPLGVDIAGILACARFISRRTGVHENYSGGDQ